MKKSSFITYTRLVFSILLISISLTDCTKTENPINFPLGTFPDTVINMTNINSAYDDYNLALYQITGEALIVHQITGEAPIVFSSNRRSSGGQFDLEQGSISFIFDQTTGEFQLEADMADDLFLSMLISKAETQGNDFGPYRLYSSLDGYEYLLLSSVNEEGNLDLFYLKNQPVYSVNNIEIYGPNPVTLLNTSSNDAYICFDSDFDSVYFASDIDGDFDIFLHQKPADKEIAAWLDLGYEISTRPDSINSTSDDKCPLIFKDFMVFCSNRPGGMGGFDLYYSVFKNGNWSSPVNYGPDVNTSSDEYRPVVWFHPDFTNLFMLFSSDRPGGKGGFDFYYKGIEFPE